MRLFTVLYLFAFCFGANAQYIYKKYDNADIVVIGRVVESKIQHGWTGRRRNHDEASTGAEIVVVKIEVTRQIKGDCPRTIDVATPHGGLGIRMASRELGFYQGAVGTTAIWFIRTSEDGDFLSGGRRRLGAPSEPTDDLFHLDGARYGLSLPNDGGSQIELAEADLPNRGNPFLDIAEALVVNAKLDPERRWYYFENLTDLSPFGFGSEDRSKLEQDMFKNWMDAHLHEALNPATDAELMDEYALRIRFGQFEYCDKFTDMFVRTKGIGMTANFPLTLGTNENGLRVYAVAEPRLARELALGFMYCTELSRRRDICKQLIARFDEDHLLDVGILEAVSKLMDWPDVSPYESETHRAFGDLSTQIEIARFRLNN